MEKIKLQLDKREFIKKSFAGQEIKIIPYIKLEEVSIIVDGILNMTIQEKDEEESPLLTTLDKIIALTKMNHSIISDNSNIDIENMDYEILTTSGIEEYVLKFIVNYNTAKQMLMDVISEYNQNLTLITMFDSLPNMDEMTDETNKLVETISSLSDEKLKMVTNNMVGSKIKETAKTKNKKSKLN